MNVLRPLAVCTLLLAVAAPQAVARDDDNSSVEVAILDVLLERGIIDEATYAELRELAVRQRQTEHELDLIEGQLQRLKAPDVVTSGGKPGKLNFASEDGKWSLGIKGRIQVQADVARGEGSNREASETNISVRRARLAFFGKAGGDNLTYKFEIDAATQNTVNKGAKDAKVTDAWLNWKLSELLEFKAGQTKFPFGREVQRSSSVLNLVDESSAADEFTPDREPLIMAYGSAGEDEFLEWWAAVSNGQGQGVANQDGIDGSPSTGMRQGVRIVINPFGKLKKDMAAFQTVQDGGLKVALGVSYMLNDDQPYDGDGDGVAGDQRYNGTTVDYEAQVFAGPFSFLAEIYERHLDVSGGLPNGNDSGYNVQAGLLFGEGARYEVVLRQSVVNLDFGDKTVESTLGFNIYNEGNNSKWAFDITDVGNKTTPDSDEVLGRASYQLIF